VFGPYTSLAAGEYELSVYGASDKVESAYVEVRSGGGALVHGRFDLPASAKGPRLLKAAVHVAANVKDLEVRLWVGKQDSLELTGYALTPAANK
jgi:hypothetical protein